MFLNVAEYGESVGEFAYPDPAAVMLPWKPRIVNVAVADVPAPVVVNDTLG